MFQFVPVSVIALVSAASMTALAFFIWKRRPAPGVNPLLVMTLGVALWSLGHIGEMSVTTLPGKTAFSLLFFAGVVLVPPAWLAFAFEYTGQDYRFNRRMVIALSIEPLLVILAILSNSSHGLFWSERTMIPFDNLIMGVNSFGPLFWLHTVYVYGLLLAALLILLHRLLQSPGLHRGQIIWLLFAFAMPVISNLIYLSGLNPLPSYFDLTLIGFTLATAALGWTLYRHRLLDLRPVARSIIFDSISEAVLVLDMSNRIVDVNQAALTLLNPSAAVIGRDVAEVVGSQSGLITRYENVLRASEEISLTIREIQRDFMLRIAPLTTPQGIVIGRVVGMTDISELKQAMQEAKEASRMKSQFLANMSHELRTPLSAITGFTEILIEGMAGDVNESQHTYLERINANAGELLNLINGLIDLAKIEAGRTDIHPEKLDIRPFFGSFYNQAQILTQSKNLDLTLNIHPTLPETIMVDSQRLNQILQNLLSNAAKFTDAGSVSLDVARGKAGGTGDTWQVAVTDTGTGIPSDKLAVIFESFRQGDGSVTRRHGGTGLGLAISRQLAGLMGGRLEVTSEEGKGSTFTLTLPLEENNATERY